MVKYSTLYHILENGECKEHSSVSAANGKGCGLKTALEATMNMNFAMTWQKRLLGKTQILMHEMS